MKYMLKNNNAVSEVVSTLLTLVIVLSVVASVLLWGLPYLEEREIKGELQTILSGFDVMDDTIRGLILDGDGAKGFSTIISTNTQSSLNVENESKKIILMYSFDEPRDIDFYVSDLDDGDSSFKIESDVDMGISKVKIYWLDPANYTDPPADAPPYKIMYQNTWCVQAFSAPDNYDLDAVKVYIMMRGLVTSDLNIYLFQDNAGNPDIISPLASSTIPAENITTSYNWIEWDLSPNIGLTQNNVYYIGLNTTGGGFGSEGYNYYKWHTGKNSPNDAINKYSLITVNDGTSWQEEHDYNFSYRLNFSNNIAPYKPCFNEDLDELYSGVEHDYDVIATDEGGDNIEYRIHWGDGNISDWSDPQPSNTLYTFSYTYAKPGNYSIKLQARDENGLIFNPDFETDIGVQVGDYLPEDRYDSEEILDPTPVGTGPYTWTIPASTDLNGTLRIDLFSNAYNPLGGPNRIPFGRIWLFELNSLTYISPHDMGTQRTIYQNGAIVTDGPINSNLMVPPCFYEEDESIGFRVIQIGRTDENKMGGSGIIEINLDMKNSFSREPRIVDKGIQETEFDKVFNFKIHFNDSIEAVKNLWINYFTNFYGFETISGRPNTILYTEDKFLVLDNSYVELSWRGMR